MIRRTTLPPILPSNHPDRVEHEERWLAHVRAGRIGVGPSTTASQLTRHFRNARIVLGEWR